MHIQLELAMGDRRSSFRSYLVSLDRWQRGRFPCTAFFRGLVAVSYMTHRGHEMCFFRSTHDIQDLHCVLRSLPLGHRYYSTT